MPVGPGQVLAFSVTPCYHRLLGSSRGSDALVSLTTKGVTVTPRPRWISSRLIFTSRSLLAGISVLAWLLSVPMVAQESLPSQSDLFQRANDRFAFELLSTAHQEFPNRNIAISPLPISLTFAAL